MTTIKNDEIIGMNLIITHKKGMPVIEIRRNISDITIIKQLIFCALNDVPVTILPCFSNKIMALNALQEKGLIYYDKNKNEYNFNI